MHEVVARQERRQVLADPSLRTCRGESPSTGVVKSRCRCGTVPALAGRERSKAPCRAAPAEFGWSRSHGTRPVKTNEIPSDCTHASAAERIYIEQAVCLLLIAGVALYTVWRTLLYSCMARGAKAGPLSEVQLKQGETRLSGNGG